MDRSPDITDMFVGGLPLEEAVALEREIESRDDVTPAQWWERMRQIARPSSQSLQ